MGWLASVRRIACVACGFAVVSSCTPAGPPDPEAPPIPTGPVHWTYEAETGPAHWGTLSRDYETCAAGTRQSPVDLTAAVAQDLPDVVIQYRASKLELLNTGHTIQATCDPGSTIELGGTRYELKQLNVHAPSEHTIDGQSFPMEIHLVHEDSAGRLAVLGVLAGLGARSAALEAMFEHLPTEVGLPRAVVDARLVAGDLVPRSRTAYRYEGSLTTPPCTEGVQWIVMATPITIDDEQLSRFTGIITGNNRPVQPLGARTVVLDSADPR